MECKCDNCGRLTGLHHIGVYTKDVGVSAAFYENLGFTVRYKTEMESGVRLAFAEAGSCVVELIQPADPQKAKTGAEGTVAHIAIAVDDIEKYVCRMYDKGVKFLSESVNTVPSLFANGSKNIFFEGPSGERLELFQEL